MALQLEYTTRQGFTAESAYARIVGGGFTPTTIQVNVNVYKDQAAREAELEPIATFVLSFPLNNGATFESLYQALKTDSNFVGAIDC